MRGGLVSATQFEGAEAALALLDRRLSRQTDNPIAVALSGGGDSLALLRLAEHWARPAGRPLLALAVDHRLNPDSSAWTDFAIARAAESGAAFKALSWDGPKPTTGLPAAARAARHALLATAAREAGASVVLLGHTRDDVEETDLMRAGDAPGIGRLRDWSPSPAWPQGRGVMLLRPLIGVRRDALRTWLTERKETWLDDPANADARFARVRARAALGAGHASEPQEHLEHGPIAVAALAATVEADDRGGLRLPLSDLHAAPMASAAAVVSAAVLCAGGGSKPPRRNEVDRLLSQLREGGRGPSTLRGARIEIKGDSILFGREAGDRVRNPRLDVEGVIDGRWIETDRGARWLALNRLRAACFLVDREADLAP